MGAGNMGDIEALRDNPGDFPHADMIPPPPFKRVEGPASIMPRTPDSSFVIDATSGTEKPQTPTQMGVNSVKQLAGLVRRLSDPEYEAFKMGWRTASTQERLSGQADRPDAQIQQDSMESVRFLQDLRAGGKPVQSAQSAQEIRKTG